MMRHDPKDPHAHAVVYRDGAPLESARAVVVLAHGRGADAADILGLAQHFAVPNVAYLAPEAAGGAWYPARFLAPLEHNQPWLDSALRLFGNVVDTVRAAGVSDERIVLGGFSQGACLALEYAARHATRFGGVIALAGGLIGPDGLVRADTGRFDGTPVFIGVGDQDAHIPVARAQHAADVLTALGAMVDLRVYRGVPHTVIPDQIEAARALLTQVAAGTPPS
ncbi:MAG: dienelactone hydrolase family protein [Gemmatimonadaceae bacterium]|jgi:glyoxalase family protein|nr:dienelactone hydrolase family protein [Gemmatimonadaceae bacterium]